MIQQNLYLVAPTAMLNVNLPLASFEILDSNGVGTGTYNTITTYLDNIGHTVERFNADGTMFLKGFNWTMATVDEVRLKCVDFGLTYSTDLLILNKDEVDALMATTPWTINTSV